MTALASMASAGSADNPRGRWRAGIGPEPDPLTSQRATRAWGAQVRIELPDGADMHTIAELKRLSSEIQVGNAELAASRSRLASAEEQERAQLRTIGPDTLTHPLFTGDLTSGYLFVVLFDHDGESPDAVVSRIQAGIDDMPVGPDKLGDVGRALFGDDRIGDDPIHLTPRRLFDAVMSPPTVEHYISHRLATELISGDGGSYKAYFDVIART